jgi:hypothetical protein
MFHNDLTPIRSTACQPWGTEQSEVVMANDDLPMLLSVLCIFWAKAALAALLALLALLLASSKSFLWIFFMASAAAVLPSCLGLPGPLLGFCTAG